VEVVPDVRVIRSLLAGQHQDAWPRQRGRAPLARPERAPRPRRRFYAEPARLAALLARMAGQMERGCRAHILAPGRMWDRARPALVADLELAVALNEAFHLQFWCGARARARLRHTGRPASQTRARAGARVTAHAEPGPQLLHPCCEARALCLSCSVWARTSRV